MSHEPDTYDVACPGCHAHAEELSGGVAAAFIAGHKLHSPVVMAWHSTWLAVATGMLIGETSKWLRKQAAS